MSAAFTRISMAPLLRLVPLVLLGGLSLNVGLLADEVPKPPSGEVRLASGRVVDYTMVTSSWMGRKRPRMRFRGSLQLRMSPRS
jgi:hypothetical protein